MKGKLKRHEAAIREIAAKRKLPVDTVREIIADLGAVTGRRRHRRAPTAEAEARSGPGVS